MTTASVSVFESSIDKGKVTLYIGAGALVVSHKLTPAEAERLCAELRECIDRMPRHRTGTPADLGYEEAA